MSKRRKKNRHAKLPMSAVAKPRYRVVAAIFLAALIVLSLGIWWWKFKSVDTSSTQNSTALANPAASASNSEFEKLKGRWQRPDGGYVLEIKSIATNGSMDAGYFNPRSIHVVKAEALRDADATKVFIELRDVNYPGSNYSPTYEPASDQLKGIYYQAVEQQRFAVVFMRV
jgi:hypothetical protein